MASNRGDIGSERTLTDPDRCQVCVCVLVMDQHEVTAACLQSLLRTVYSPLEVAIVDNGSFSRTRAMLLEFQDRWVASGCRCTVLLNSHNVGASIGRNQALALSGSPFVAFVDNDTEFPDPFWLAKLVDHLESDDQLAAVGPKLVFRDRPNIIQSAGGGVSPSGRPCDMGRGMPKEHGDFCVSRDVQFQSSACIVAKRTAIEQIGGFDPTLSPCFFEDIELCYRLRSEGYRIQYVPDAEVMHRENTTTFRSGRINAPYLFAKHLRVFKSRWAKMFTQEAGPCDEIVRSFNRR